jgi:hypothetical protein
LLLAAFPAGPHRTHRRGRTTRRLVLSGLGALTSSERRVAQLATTGLSDRDIAELGSSPPGPPEGTSPSACQELAITFCEQLPAARTPPAAGSGDRNR